MSKVFGFISTITLLFSLLIIAACATMDRSECEVANWEIIGLEDGAVGRPNSYIGQHRSACAEYGISPDLNLYMEGHKRGLLQYCSYQSGFDLGNRGYNFNNVCNEINQRQFSQGYHQGKRHYALRVEIAETQTEMQQQRDYLHQLEHEIEQREDIIVAGQTNSHQRRDLLEEIEALRLESDEIEHLLESLGSQLFSLEQRYERIDSQSE